MNSTPASKIIPNYPHSNRIVVLENGLISSYTARKALMKELVQRGFEVYILTHTNPHQEIMEKMSVRVIHVGSANSNPMKMFRYVRNLYHHMRKIQPAVCLTFSVRPTIWGNLVARKLNIPVLTNITGTGPLFSSTHISYRIVRAMYPYALKKTRKVFFQNTDDRDQFINNGYVLPEKTALIPGSGVDHEKFKPIPYRKLDESAFTFLYIGRLIRDKGVMEYIQAAEKMKAKYPRASFKIIGPLWRQNLKSNQLSADFMRECEAKGILEYLGEKTDVREYIAAADSVVLPSYREGTSNVLLEASSMGKPCIASDVPGCREVVEDGVTGLLCRVKDSNDLAEKMEQLYHMERTDLREMGKNAREKVIREFDKKIVLKHYIHALNEILNLPQEQVEVSSRYIKSREKNPYQLHTVN